MACTVFTENGLNVKYVANFFEKEQADEYLSELRMLPFYQPTLHLRGKTIRPNRLVLAYGESNLCYTFSGTSIPAEPWTPLMLKLRDEVEKFTACTFNYVLLNMYPDGSSSIAQHKDNESGLHSTFPIAVVSFGAKRTIEFRKHKTPSTFLKLDHGSLYCMQDATNKLFTHGIAPEPDVKTLRISLTFRHLIDSQKKPRLELQCLRSPDTAVTNCVSQDCDLVLPQNDWLSQTFQKAEAIAPFLNEWNLNRNTLMQIVMNSNFNIRLHIREFKESKNGHLTPTKTGVVLTQPTWFDFQSKIPKINFKSCSESFVANNQLLLACIDENTALVQQIFPLNGSGFHLKPTVLKLFKDQIINLCELRSQINDFLIEVMLTIQLPKLILSKPPICNSHLNYEDCKHNFFRCICMEIVSYVCDTTDCDACKTWPANQNLHICTRPVFETYSINRQNILLQIDVQKIAQNIRKNCSCFLDALFFSELNIKMCMERIEELLYQHKDV